MNKFLKWLTREREETIYGMALIFSMGLIYLHSMEIARHPVHIEVNHAAMEEEYSQIMESFSERQKLTPEESMRKFETEMQMNRLIIEEHMKDVDTILRDHEKQESLMQPWEIEEKELFYKDCEEALRVRRKNNDWSNS